MRVRTQYLAFSAVRFHFAPAQLRCAEVHDPQIVAHDSEMPVAACRHAHSHALRPGGGGGNLNCAALP